MYVRARQNATGTKTIYLIDSFRVEGKKSSCSKMIKCFGSSADQKQLDQWIAEANELKAKLESKNSRGKNFIEIRQESDLTDCHSISIGVSYFYKLMYEQAFSKLKLNGVNKDTLANLVTMRLVQPLSKLKTAKIASDYGIEQLSINKIYKMMDTLSDDNIEKVKKYVFKHSQNLLGNKKLKVLFYDLTTIYFEANISSELKEFGYSKDGKSQHVQISLAMIVTECGLPLGYEIFKGNSFEGHTLIPTLNKLKAEYGINDITIVADSAMLSDENIKALEANNYKYIVAARVKNMGKTTTEALLDDAGYIEVNEGELKYKVINLVKEEQNQSEHPARFIKNLIACYSKRRKRKDEYDRSKALSRINKTIGKTTRSQLKGVLSKSYVGTNMTASEAETITINEKKLNAATRLEGYFGYITNTNLPPDEIIAQYKGLWQVEQTFRVTKHNLAIRPVYHFVDRRIKAHFAICYLSLALLRTVEMGLRKANQYLPIEELHMLLSRMHQVKLTVGKRQCTIITEREAVAKIFAGLGLVLPPKLQLASC